jgi:hypothetical protein
MKYVKILGLLAVAAAAMMAFAASASATTITSPTGTAATPTIHAVNENGHVTLKNEISPIECTSTVEGKVEKHGAGVTAEGKISKLLFEPCTDSWHVTAVKNADGFYGSLIVHWENGYNGTLTSTGTKVVATRFFVPCTYLTNNTPIGTVTGGKTATLKIEASIPLVAAESSELCGKGNAEWNGSYVTTSELYIDA